MRYQVPGFLFEMCKIYSPACLPWQALLSPSEGSGDYPTAGWLPGVWGPPSPVLAAGCAGGGWGTWWAADGKWCL